MSAPHGTGGGGRRDRIDITADHVVLAEGKDDTDLARHLLRVRGDRVQVVDARGRDGIVALVRLVTLDARFRRGGRSLGVVLDADDDPVGMFDLVADSLGSTGLSRPPAPEVIATSPGGQVTTGVFVLPGQGRTGTVEDLYLPVVAPERRRLADSYLTDVASAGLPSPRSTGKAALQSVLAALPRSPRQPGDGLQHGLVHDDTALRALQTFLLQLTK